MYDSCRSQVSQCMTPPGVKFVIMYDKLMVVCMTPAGVNYVGMYDSCRSQVSQCMTPAGVKYVIMYDSCRSQVCHYV